MARRTPDLSPPSEDLEQPTIAGAPLARRSSPSFDAEETPRPFSPFDEEPTMDAQAFLSSHAARPLARRTDPPPESSEEPTEDRRRLPGDSVPRLDEDDDSSESATRVMLEPFDVSDESLQTQGAVPGRMREELGMRTMESRFAPKELGAMPNWGLGGDALPVASARGAPPAGPGAETFPPAGAPLAPRQVLAHTAQMPPGYQPPLAPPGYGPGATAPPPGLALTPGAPPYGAPPGGGPAGAFPGAYAGAYPQGLPGAGPGAAPGAPAAGAPSTAALVAVGAVTMLVATPLIVAALWFFLR